ncbi:MAG TPA: hypothetical protein DDY13_06525 [Cytophagales bacterium]|jgi:opacity protein-like surface antigen|nr:hypothetical protein [Cytophagales bacterium]
MKASKTIIAILLMLIHTSKISAQEPMENEKSARHSIGISIAHAHISQGIQDGDRKWITEPSFLLDYNFELTSRWIIGIHTDLVLQTFEIKKILDESVIERSNPLSVVAVAGFKPVEYWTVFVGGGIELEEKESFGLIRIGLERNIEISDQWEIPLSLTYDAKINVYDTWSLGIGIARRF